MRAFSIFVFVATISALWCTACGISDDEGRCTGDYGWDPDQNSCILKSAGDTTGGGGDTEPDGGDDAGDETGGGIGVSCSSDEECEALGDGLFCGDNPNDQYCSSACTESPDSCPSGFVCCVTDMVDTGSLCMKESEYADVGEMACGG